jgi:hypothetical protein
MVYSDEAWFRPTWETYGCIDGYRYICGDEYRDIALNVELGRFLFQVKDLEEPHLTQAVNVGFPTIVKTMMACGTADAHTMVI